MPEEDVRIAEYSSRIEAELARTRLEACGIEARIDVDDVGGAYPQLQFAGVGLFVPETSVEQAEEILSQVEPAADEVLGEVVVLSIRERQ